MSTLVATPSDHHEPRNRSDLEVRDRFRVHFAKWVQDTSAKSSYAALMTHPSYQAILGLGLPAVPYLLQEISTGGGGALIAALEAITGENPIRPEHESSSKLMVEDWLAWGKANGYI